MANLIKSVLTVIGTQSEPTEIANAIGACKGLEAHLTVLVMDLAMPAPVSQYAMANAIHRGEEYEHGLKAVHDKAASVTAELKASKANAEVLPAYVLPGEVDNVIAEHASCSDLTIFPTAVPIESVLYRHALHGALFKAGGPVLLLPVSGASFPSIDQALIAWDGGAQAARAVRASIGLLGQARQVQSVIISAERDDVDQRLVRYLDHHEISVSAKKLATDGASVSQSLLTAAQQEQADLIVMGAYGHSRLRERIFGGTTRDMIEKATVPVLMSH